MWVVAYAARAVFQHSFAVLSVWVVIKKPL
jgi:hypothetical protein